MGKYSTGQEDFADYSKLLHLHSKLEGSGVEKNGVTSSENGVDPLRETSREYFSRHFA